MKGLFKQKVALALQKHRESIQIQGPLSDRGSSMTVSLHPQIVYRNCYGASSGIVGLEAQVQTEKLRLSK